MSVLKVNKFQQLEGGPFTAVNNLCNVFIEPQAGVIDLTKSYVELETKFKNQGGEYVTEGVFLGYVDPEQDEEVNYTPACLIKHCKLQSDKKGLLEENRFINRLNQTLEGMTKYSQDHVSSYVYGRADPILLSEDLQTANLQVPISDILGVGTLSQFPAEWLGKLQLQIEFENQNQLAYQQFDGVGLQTIDFKDMNNTSGSSLSVKTLTTSTTDTFSTVDNWFPAGAVCSITYNRTDETDETTVNRVVESASLNSDGTITVSFTEILEVLPNGVNMTDIVLNDNGIDCVPIADLGEEDEHDTLTDNTGNNNFNVGDNIVISFSQVAGTQTVYSILATKILTKVQNEGAWIYTIEDELPEGNVSDILVVEHDWSALSFEIQKVNVVLYGLPMKAAANAMTYETYHLEMDNMLETMDYRHQFNIEENVVRALMLTPVNSLISVPDNASSFRVSVDNVDTTNRDVVLDYADDNSLYYDRLVQNMKTISNFALVNDNADLFVIPQQMPQDGMRHALNVRLYSDNVAMTAKVVYVFKSLAVEFTK
jgi:hypothetical protein